MVKFDEAFAAARWRVGVHVADVPKATLTVGLLSLKSDTSKPFLKQFESIVNWPQSGIRKEAGKIEYLGVPETGDIAVHIVLPKQTRLRIDAGPIVLFSSAVSRDVLIDDKGVSEQSMKSIAALMAVTLINPNASMPDVGINASGAKLVSLANLKAHLQASIRPRFPDGVQLDRPEHVIIKGTITTEGKVTDMAAMRGSQALAASCLTALESWRFRPFVVGGAKSEAVGTFVFGFDPNGTVLVPAAWRWQVVTNRCRRSLDPGEDLDEEGRMAYLQRFAAHGAEDFNHSVVLVDPPAQVAIVIATEGFRAEFAHRAIDDKNVPDAA
jgi:hypothetical protein